MDKDDLLQMLAQMHILKQLQGRAGQASARRRGTSPTSSTTSTTRLDPGYLLVAAFDFGTTYSGYAFSFKYSKDDIKMNKNWGASVGCAMYKTPTCVLITPDRKFHSFGFEAQKKYSDMAGDEAQSYYYFERFKMALHDNQRLNRDTKITAANGKAFPALDVITLSLKFLKDHLMEALEKSSESKAEASLVRWVLTVPAIWSDASKQFMREAAQKAGLTKDVDSNHLVIALEPEAASLYCRTLNPNKFTLSAQKIEAETGTKYLVLDAGGGTLDVTAHEIQGDGSVKELHYATGGALGGTRVDDEFQDLMEELLGKDFIKSYRKECASNWLQMMVEFDSKKRSIKAKESSTLNIQLNWSIAGKYQEKNKKSIESVFNPCKVDGVRFSNGMIIISYERSKKLFEPVLKKIVAHIKSLVQMPNLRGLKYFFLVGGFAESSLLQQTICDSFGSSYKILVPEDASLAVVKGAVLFGHNPSAINSRVSARTYGVELCTEFVEGKHSERKAKMVDGVKHCGDVFEPFVEIGKEIPDGFSKDMQFKPARESQDAATVSIYSAERKNVQYIDEDGVQHNGDIRVQWPGTGLGRTLTVSMTFGGTEIHVNATAYPGGDSASTKINFLTQ